MKHYNLLSLFDDFEREIFRAPAVAKKNWTPTSFVEEKDKHYLLSLDVPGVDQEHLKVDLEDRTLTITGERSDIKARRDEHTESFYKFESRYSLPDDINEDEVDVSLHNGVLDIMIPKFQKKAQTRTLSIKSGPNQLT